MGADSFGSLAPPEPKTNNTCFFGPLAKGQSMFDSIKAEPNQHNQLNLASLGGSRCVLERNSYLTTRGRKEPTQNIWGFGEWRSEACGGPLMEVAVSIGFVALNEAYAVKETPHISPQPPT